MPKHAELSKCFLQLDSKSNGLRREVGLDDAGSMLFNAKYRRRWIAIILGGIGIYIVLLIPETAPPVTEGAGKQPFAWARDALWQDLEKQLQKARQSNSAERVTGLEVNLERVQRALDEIAITNLPPNDPAFDKVEASFFQCAVSAAVNAERNKEFMQAASRFANLARWQSQAWPDSTAARQRSYRLMFGRRAAVEEVMLQIAPSFDPVELVADTNRRAIPFADVQGVRIHSGDIFVSRGGAATSALIARGNDFRGNFSHVALIHVDAETKQVSVIESHIESGVGVRLLGDYLADTKLRIMVLRLRDDLSEMRANPLLPHLAASAALSNSLARHIPYDFAMDHTDPAKQFCSEVVSSAYRTQNVRLWAALSQVSAPGLVQWLTLLGVRNFASEQPSDLEYDPHLCFVAEWRNPEALLQDHMDNAILDARLEAAERGARLEFNHWLLPPMRVLKAGCWLLNQFGATGPIPEGMSATTALRVERFKAEHEMARQRLRELVTQFQKTNGYVPPYWELLKLAREAIR